MTESWCSCSGQITRVGFIGQQVSGKAIWGGGSFGSTTGQGCDEKALALAPLPDGRLMVAAGSLSGDILLRMRCNGTVDEALGDGGVVQANSGKTPA